MVKNKAVYVALGVSRDGVREVLGLWIADNEGAKFWLSYAIESLNRVICKSLRTRGSFPTADAATKLIYLAIQNFEKGGRNNVRGSDLPPAKSLTMM
ncbi:hypothetical protein A3734_19065 [Sulfitobacter sp. HI0054]|nr:hypothetical protein A3734_19065 [Sulfitobacter sp. HI0054]|tara:strand:+ start:556 stop:846 length:291 start_codon:yes stop_codon:yes gene_type:complete